MTKHHPAVTSIAARIAALYGIESAEPILGTSRSKTIAEARAVTHWAARTRLGWSFPELAKAFDRHHTGILYTVGEVARKLADGSASKLMQAAAAMYSADAEESQAAE